jgi:hypothetical protein
VGVCGDENGSVFGLGDHSAAVGLSLLEVEGVEGVEGMEGAAGTAAGVFGEGLGEILSFVLARCQGMVGGGCDGGDGGLMGGIECACRSGA